MPRNRIALASLAMALASALAPARAGEPRWKKHDINARSVFEGAAGLRRRQRREARHRLRRHLVQRPGLDPLPGPEARAGRPHLPELLRHPADGRQRRRLHRLRLGLLLRPGRRLGREPRQEGGLLGLPPDRQAGTERGRRPGRRRRRRQARRPAQLGQGRRLVLAGEGRADPHLEEARPRDRRRRPRGRDRRRQRRRPKRPPDPQGLVRSPLRPQIRSLGWHPEWDLGATGIQILARDVDGDSLPDLIYGVGHAFGLYWSKQGRGPQGERTWTKLPIDESYSSVHTQLWADLDGDGKADELVTGKRVYAHEIEAGDVEAPVIAWYSYKPGSSGSPWTRHVIDQGEPAKDAPKDGSKRDAQKDFPPGTAGTGLEMMAVDIDKDGDLDILCPGKSGLYLFENLTRSR